MEKRLIHIVEKRNNLAEGTFANINNDLNDSITMDVPPMILMAYGYARRTAAAGLYLQGVFPYDAYKHASAMFRGLQLMTGHTKAFQIEAGKQAQEYLASYDDRFTGDFVRHLTTLVECSGETLYQPDPAWPYEHTMAYLTATFSLW